MDATVVRVTAAPLELREAADLVAGAQVLMNLMVELAEG